tara:strand:- start:53 stop:256 length:204 start_codon:yes stop_codon:yes gene_type:complete
MNYDHIRSWYELEEITEKQEKMITIYEQEIETLKQEKEELRREVSKLKKQLESQFALEKYDISQKVF